MNNNNNLFKHIFLVSKLFLTIFSLLFFFQNCKVFEESVAPSSKLKTGNGSGYGGKLTIVANEVTQPGDILSVTIENGTAPFKVSTESEAFKVTELNPRNFQIFIPDNVSLKDFKILVTDSENNSAHKAIQIIGKNELMFHNTECSYPYQNNLILVCDRSNQRLRFIDEDRNEVFNFDVGAFLFDVTIASNNTFWVRVRYNQPSRRYEYKHFDSKGTLLNSYAGDFARVGPDGNVYITRPELSKVEVYKPDGTFINSLSIYISSLFLISDDGEIYSLEEGSVKVYDLDGKYLRSFTLEYSGSTSIKTVKLKGDKIYVQYIVDVTKAKVVVFETTGEFVEEYPKVRGFRNFSLDSKGNLLVARNSQIDILSFEDLSVVESFGAFSDGPYGFNSPHDSVYDKSGNFHILDTGNQKIKVYSPFGVFLREFPVLKSTFSHISFNDKGQYVLAGSGSTYVELYDTTGKFIKSIKDSNFSSGSIAFFGNDQLLYFLDNYKHIFLVYDQLGNQIEEIPWPNSPGDKDNIHITGLVATKSGQIFVSTPTYIMEVSRLTGSRIRSFEDAGIWDPVITKIIESKKWSLVVSKKQGAIFLFDTESGKLIQRYSNKEGISMWYPDNVTVGPNLELMILDSGNHRVQIIRGLLN